MYNKMYTVRQGLQSLRTEIKVLCSDAKHFYAFCTYVVHEGQAMNKLFPFKRTDMLFPEA